MIFNPLSANSTKWLNMLKQFALKGLKKYDLFYLYVMQKKKERKKIAARYAKVYLCLNLNSPDHLNNTALVEFVVLIYSYVIFIFL